MMSLQWLMLRHLQETDINALFLQQPKDGTLTLIGSMDNGELFQSNWLTMVIISSLDTQVFTSPHVPDIWQDYILLHLFQDGFMGQSK